MNKTPDFWYKPLSWKAIILLPLTAIYAFFRMLHSLFQGPSWIPPLPVICVGNFIVGGAGKTPVARALHTLLSSHQVHFLTRGYKGKQKGPLRVENHHQVIDVGDEALLLHQDAPTWVARQRQRGIQAAYNTGAEIIIMDDGLQNLTIKKNLCFAVIDQQMAFGNGCLLPAGPLREPLTTGFKRVNACIIIKGEKNVTPLPLLAPSLPTFIAVKKITNISDIPKKALLAFAGIGYPKKFFSMLRDAAFTLIETVGFPDHYQYTSDDIQYLRQRAETQHALLVTTEKDYVRLPLKDRQGIMVVKMHLEWQDPMGLTQFIHQFL